MGANFLLPRLINDNENSIIVLVGRKYVYFPRLKSLLELSSEVTRILIYNHKKVSRQKKIKAVLFNDQELWSTEDDNAQRKQHFTRTNLSRENIFFPRTNFNIRN